MSNENQSKAAWTPGPWAVAWTFDVVPADHVGRKIGYAEDENAYRNEYAQQIAVVPKDRFDRGLREANAHLIAAAPELYAALSAFVEHYTDMINSGDCGNWNPEEEKPVIAARAALSRARGEK